jgi:hypothetical protein
MQSRKKSYLVAFIALLVLGTLAYYANKQADYFSLKDHDYPDQETLKIIANDLDAEYERTSLAIETNVAQADTKDSTKTPLPKTEGHIFILSEYLAKPEQVEVTKGKQINLYLKTDRYHSANGLVFQAPMIPPVEAKPGDTATINFVAESDFVIDVYKLGTDEKVPYTLQITVK